MKYTHYTPKRVKQPDRPRWRLPVLLAAVLVSLGLLMAPNGEAHVAEARGPPPPPPPPPGGAPPPPPPPPQCNGSLAHASSASPKSR